MNDEEGSRQNGIAALLEKYFSSCMDVRLAFLFGSAARGRLSRSSDVDVAVYFEGEYSSEEMNSLWRDLEGLLDRDVDLLVLNKDNPTLAWSAMRGIPLLIRDYTFYLEYMLQISREAEDFQDFIIDLWRAKMALRGGSG